MKLLLHSCCAPCSVYPIKTLKAENIQATIFWYNPNIHPYTEYKARRNCLREYAKLQNLALIEDDDYGLDDFVCHTANSPATRCQDYCYPTRLEQLFRTAKAQNFDAVSTTLLYSIYQKHEIIDELMQALSAKYQIQYYYQDWREGWQTGQEEARRIGLYMQKYCGCLFSEEESMLGRDIARKLQAKQISPTNANVRRLIDRAKQAQRLNKQSLLAAVEQEFFQADED